MKHHQRKCRCCKKWFTTDPRNHYHQRFCLKIKCRKVSKAASQKRWQSKPTNQKHWCGPDEVDRVLSLTDADPQIHAHVVLGRADTTTRGGHLIRSIVRPTLEVMLIESPTHLFRKYNSDFGLALINLEKTA